MVSINRQKIPVFVRFVIERYEDGPQGNLDEARKTVLGYAGEIVTNPPEESVVTFAQYFDLVKVDAYDRYEDDEDDGEDFGEEDRYCVELTYIAKFVIEAKDEQEASDMVFTLINERCEDCIDESIEHYATNLNACLAFPR